MPIKIIDAPPHPWGDYGDILVHGMADAQGRAPDGALELERTGPFVPPITFPGSPAIVVSDDFRGQLKASGLTGFTFRLVRKARIVLLEWHAWDQHTPEPLEVPDSGEPEDYVLQRPHDPKIAEAMGPLWEVVLSPGVTVQRERAPKPANGDLLYVLRRTWSGADIFFADGVGYIYASERAQDWLLRTVPDWVRFKDCLLR